MEHWARPLLRDRPELTAEAALGELVTWARHECSSVVEDWQDNRKSGPEKAAIQAKGDTLLKAYGACRMVQIADEQCGSPGLLLPDHLLIPPCCRKGVLD